MPSNPETQALLEQALRHVLAEQGKLLNENDSVQLLAVISSLNQLAVATTDSLGRVNHRVSTAPLLKKAKKIEKLVDDASETLWRHIPVSVSAIYERIQNSFVEKPGKEGLMANTRAHYHNLRIRLLNQMLAARMLVLNRDLGDEHERLWQRFLERHLGPSFKVLPGGHIYNHAGQRSDCQIDLLVLPADADVIIPGDSEEGKTHAFVDQVISAVMITSNLTVSKFKKEWRKLQSLPAFSSLDSDFPGLKGHPWPLCYFVAAQSDPAEDLKTAWEELCREGSTRVMPQFVILLDTGYLYSGSRKWPAPLFPSNYKNPDDVHIEGGIYGGLGLAWLLAQHRARLGVMQNRPVGNVDRIKKVLDDASLRQAVPATHSSRFDTFFRMRPIFGPFGWGSSSFFPHNRLELQSLTREREGVTNAFEREVLQDDVDVKKVNMDNRDGFLRWFRYGRTHQYKKLLALEEWINPKSNPGHSKRIAVFNTVTGDEIKGAQIDALRKVSDIEKL